MRERTLNKTPERDREILERIEEPEKYAGYWLSDPLDQRIGKVEKVFVSASGKPQYVRVGFKSGLFGNKSLLLPVETMAVSIEHMTMILQ